MRQKCLDISTENIDPMFGRFYRAVRKDIGFTQAEFGEILKQTQGTLSKIESEFLNPTASDWVDFCCMFNLPANCFKYGYIDKVNVSTCIKRKKRRYKTPIEYATLGELTVHPLIPLFDFFIESEGRDAFCEFIKDLGIDYDYLTFRRHPLSYTFMYSIFDHLTTLGKLRDENINKMAKTALSLHAQGKFYDKYIELLPLERIIKLVSKEKNTGNLISNFNVKRVGKNKLVLIRPNSEDIYNIVKDKSARLYLQCDYFQSYLNSFAQNIGAPKVEVEELKCIFNGDDNCSFKVTQL